MNQKEMKVACKYLASLYTTLNEVQVKTFIDSVSSCRLADVTGAIKAHYQTHAFMDNGSLYAGVQAIAQTRNLHQQKQASIRVIDWLRTDYPAKCVGLSDVECIVGHYSGAWQAVISPNNPHPSTDYGKAYVRRYIWGVCTGALVEAGLDRPSAEEFARQCVQMEEGETFKLPDVGVITQEAARV